MRITHFAICVWAFLQGHVHVEAACSMLLLLIVSRPAHVLHKECLTRQSVIVARHAY